MIDIKVEKVAAFSDGRRGGNPTGVFLLEEEIETADMQAYAEKLGFTETAFASREKDGSWRARYFSPQGELPFCGHGSTTLGAVLANKFGTAEYQIRVRDFKFTVYGEKRTKNSFASTKSPVTSSFQLNATRVSELLDIFGYSRNQLNPNIPPALINAGADHYVLALRDRADLADMYYEMEEGYKFMPENDIFSIMLISAVGNQTFHARNAYAAWGAMEDPATAAAAAALSGYLRDIGWPHNNALTIIQGEDMGAKSVLKTKFTDEKNSPVIIKGHMNFLN